MTFGSFKNYTIAILMVIGITACTDFAGGSQSTVVSHSKYGKTYHHAGKYPRRGSDLAAKTLVGGISNPSFFFNFSSGNLWDRLRADFQLPSSYENQPAVQAQIRWFMRNSEFLNRTVTRAAPYMYYIFDQVRQRNLPGELVLLPVIESAYNPFVRSSAGALGLWQLMPGTARGLGVRQNFWFDGRRDIFASTKAALNYLTYLQGYFGGDWLLAIAAYDTGEGNVQNAIRKNAVRDRSTAFWSLPLAAETRAYVPRLLALALIIKNPSKYGIVLPTISDKPYFEQVDVGSSIKLNQAARLADMSLAELKQLNPGYTRNATDPTGHHKLILPIERIALFKERLMNERSGTTQLASADEDDVRSARVDDADEEVSTTQFTHTIKRGDTLGSIAKRHSVSVDDLKRWNRSKTNKKLKLGTKLIIVKAETEAAPTVSRSRVAKNNQSDSRKAEQARELAARQTTSHKRQIAKASTTTHYTVRSGDSLVKIATRHGMKTTELKRMNNLSSNALKPGQRLVVSS